MLGISELGFIAAILLIAGLLAWASFTLARRKGREPWMWAVATLVFAPAILVLLVARARPANETL